MRETQQAKRCTLHKRRVGRFHPGCFAASHLGQLTWDGSAGPWRWSLRHCAFNRWNRVGAVALGEAWTSPTLIHNAVPCSVSPTASLVRLGLPTLRKLIERHPDIVWAVDTTAEKRVQTSRQMLSRRMRSLNAGLPAIACSRGAIRLNIGYIMTYHH